MAHDGLGNSPPDVRTLENETVGGEVFRSMPVCQTRGGRRAVFSENIE